MYKKQNPRNISQLTIGLFSFLFLGSGLLLLLFPTYSAKIFLSASNLALDVIIIQMLGSAYTLLGLICYFVRKARGNAQLGIISSLNIIGFTNLYPIFMFYAIIQLPIIYIVFQVTCSLILLIAFAQLIAKRLGLKNIAD